MSCWVAPNIAAEFWGLTLQDILSLIAEGRMPSFDSGSFRFVRLPRLSPAGQPLPFEERPPTFQPVDTEIHLEATPSHQAITPEEHAALAGAESAGADSDESEMGPPPDEDPNDNRISGWREGRRAASARRRGPGQKR